MMMKIIAEEKMFREVITKYIKKKTLLEKQAFYFPLLNPYITNKKYRVEKIPNDSVYVSGDNIICDPQTAIKITNYFRTMGIASYTG